jgi:formylmethanofuran dehydrogenase subunit B
MISDDPMISDDEDVCGICGSICDLNDMYILVKTKTRALNICFICREVYRKSVKDFTVLVYNNRVQIKSRVGSELYNAMTKKFNPDSRMIRLFSKLRKKNK